MEIKIIFIDVDGTLFNDNHSLTRFNRQICIDAQKKGIIVVINTGRITENAIEVAKQIEAHRFNGFVIANNGVHIYSFKDKQLIFNGNMNDTEAKNVYRWITNNKNWKCQLYSETGSFVNRKGDNSSYWADVMEAQYTVLGANDNLIKDVARIIIISKEIDNEIVSKQFMHEFQTKFSSLAIKEYRAGIYEITKPKLSKGFAAQYLCNLLNINLENAMAFGDSYNDKWLMQTVGHPVAMENSVDIIKTLANYMCGNNNENGVGEMIKTYILEK